MKDMKEKYKKDKKSGHCLNFIISLCKIATALAFFFANIESRNHLPSYAMKATYETRQQTVTKPGPPPGIPFNETFQYDPGLGLICKPATTAIRAAGAYEAYPDDGDCTAYWSRTCASQVPLPSLNYTVCPEGEAFGFNSPDYACISAGTCCTPYNETDCGNRTQYNDSCLNNDIMERSFKFPNESAEFTNAEGVYDWSIVLEEAVTHIYPLAVLAIQISSTYLAYWLCYFACQSQVQREAFAIPVTFSQILILVPLIMMCSEFQEDPCFYSEAFPSGMFFNCNDWSFTSFVEHNWIFIIAFVSQAWITIQIWKPKSERLAQVDDIFVGSFYESLLIEQSLIFRLDQNKKKDKTGKEEKKETGDLPRIIGCATMWHETKEEMELLLQSVLEMNETNQDTFTWKLRIFFDDAFKENGCVNEYVLQLFEAMDSVHTQRNIEKPIPILEDTPYGGNITWKLHGTGEHEGTKVVCHLKDKRKIRHKKRWSQCMYFEYFKLKSEGQGNRNGIQHAVQKMAGKVKEKGQYFPENTFVLALDGDVDFKPDAVVKLLDVMKKNEDIGAACGRIHPTGSGILPIYQQFEYAAGHWLQKSTEDALGNVLCSPGCFSLFRLKAVIDNNLKRRSGEEVDGRTTFNRKEMKKREEKEDLYKTSLEKYFTKSTEARHCIQYDQGEDRWLCTLLIARGWEVEYVASSHSYTACPESFDEFYNQRRRWSPSTVANLLDLLSKWRILLRYGNGNVVHMLYQVLTISASAIGPGGIFLMLVGGCHMVFEMGYWAALSLNSALILIFLLVSMFEKTKKYQLLVAKALSILYAILMLVIMVLLVIEAIRLRETCSISPSTFSLILVCSAFLLAGLLHIRQFWKLRFLLLHGAIYYLTIPSMYMLLPFYCVFNLNDVSWGTRETVEMKEEKKTGEPKENFKAKVENLEAVDWKDDIKRTQDKPPHLIQQSEKEKEIWNKIKNNLLPLNQSKEEKQKIKHGLDSLRTETFLFFLFVNVAFVFVVFLLQVRFEEFNRFTVNWPLCKISMPIIPAPEPINVTTTTATPFLFENYNPRSAQPDITEDEVRYFTLDPINLVFMAFFLGVMFFQVIGMIFHRIRTVGHLLSRTKWGMPKEEKKKQNRKKEQVAPGYTFDVYKSNEPGTNFDSYPSLAQPNKNVQSAIFLENANTDESEHHKSNTTNSYVNIDEIATESTLNEDIHSSSSSSSSNSNSEANTPNQSENPNQHRYMSSENIHHIYTNPTVINYTSETIAHL